MVSNHFYSQMNQSMTGRMTGNAGGSVGGKKWGDTTSKKGEVSRIFVGNTDPKNISLDDLESKFSAYGKIQGIDINPNGFSFVQFQNVNDAQRAVNGENGTILKGKKIEVRMFDKSGPPKRKLNRDRSRSPLRGSSNLGPSTGVSGSSYAGQGVLSQPPGAPPPQMSPGNDIEIIVVNKDQWRYAEMIEGRLRRETPIKYIDLLFLHSPQHITMTLNDLFERRTLYAIVVTPVNEEHKSLSLHVLHSQTEHRNIPLDSAIDLITQDFRAFMARRGGLSPLSGDKQYDPFRQGGQDSSSNLRSGLISNATASATYSTSVAAAVSSTSGEKRLPDDIAYLLRTTLSEGGVQFLSLPQIDSIIEYFSRERDRLTSQARQQQLRTQSEQTNFSQNFAVDQFQQQTSASVSADNASNLLDNPQLKAALNSLLHFGAIGGNQTVASQNPNFNSNLNQNLPNLGNNLNNQYSVSNKTGVEAMQSSVSEAPSYLSTSATVAGAGQPMNAGLAQGAYNQSLRRHPLLGTELGSSSGSMNAFSGMSGLSLRAAGGGQSNRGFASGQRY